MNTEEYQNGDILEYGVIANPDLKELIAKVREWINDGHEPLGGVVVIPETEFQQHSYMQTLVKKTKPTGN